MPTPAAILDVDGTLVDNNYQHALAWHEALRRCDIVVPLWRVHRAVGIGGDKFVAHLAGEEAEREIGDAARDHEKELFGAMRDDVIGVEGATEFVHALKERGNTVVVASSGNADDIEFFLDLLEIKDVVDGWTTSDDVDASKPEPDLMHVALEKAGGGPAVMVGDTNWDVEAAAKAGLETIAVLSGGFPEAVLREAGAAAIYDDVDALRRDLDDSLLQ
jgi:HAD superfamily hydrolase (TIGR01549 family)